MVRGRSARSAGAKFNGASRTWDIPADRPETGNLKAYGLMKVESPITDPTDPQFDLNAAMADDDSIY